MKENIKKINYEQAKKLLDEKSGCIMLDVREESEFFVMHADGAVLFPVDSIDEANSKKLIPSKDTPIIVYCKSGRRAAIAAQKLDELGYKEIYNLGSLVDWPYKMSFGAY